MQHWREAGRSPLASAGAGHQGFRRGTVACLPAIHQAGMSQDNPPCLRRRQGTHSSGAHAWTHSRCSAVAGPESHVQHSYEATPPISGGASSQTLGSVVSLTLALIPDLTAHTLVAA